MKKENSDIDVRVYHCCFSENQKNIDYFSSKQGFKHDEGMHIIKKVLTEDKLEIADINKTHTCPLARVMRRELKKRGIKKQLVLFSTEKPTKPQFRQDGTSPGTCSFVPPVAGFILAAHVLRTILEVEPQ